MELMYLGFQNTAVPGRTAGLTKDFVGKHIEFLKGIWPLPIDLLLF